MADRGASTPRPRQIIESDVDDLLDAHVALRRAALARCGAFIDSPRATEALRERLEPLHRLGTVRAAEHAGRVAAVLAWRHDPEPWYGAPVSSIALDYDLAFVGIERWLDDVLDHELPRMEADLDLLLDASYTAAYRALRARGVGVGSLQLLGEPRVALARLLADRDVPRELARWDLDVMPLAMEQIDDVIALVREAFTTYPEHCWFGATEGSLTRMRSRLAETVAERDHVERVLMRGDRVLGHVQATVRDDPYFGPTAGMSLTLSPELRGRGLARSLYRILLEAMIERGARTFRGGTSQPAVIRIGALMGRPLQAWIMRRRTYFPDAHFAPYLQG